MPWTWIKFVCSFQVYILENVYTELVSLKVLGTNLIGFGVSQIYF